VGRISVTDGSRAYTVNIDDPRARGDLFQAIVIAQLVDELTGEPVREHPQVSSRVRGMLPRFAADGIAGLAGVPTRLLPKLRTQPYSLDVTFTVDGFLPLTVDPEPSLGPQGAYPTQFDPIDLHELKMRRRPVVLIVRTVELDAQNHPQALPLAVASISGIWRTAQDVVSTVAPAPANLVSYTPGLYAARPQPVATIASVTLTPAADPLRNLLFDVGPGDTRLVVNRGGGLAPGAIVGIDRADTDRVEHIEVAQVDAPTDPESPAVFDLRFPVQRRHHVSAPVERVTPGAPTPLANLTDAGRPGDPTLFVNSVATVGPNPTVVQISGGAAATEYGTCSRYRVVTNADGYGTLPPLSRVAAVEIGAVLGALSSPPQRVTANYREFENRVDLTLA
jgi:hypothetical protein